MISGGFLCLHGVMDSAHAEIVEVANMKREQLGSRLGFILISAGCAIGIGNVWKFPYLVGQNGGGLFVLIYLVFLIALGVPVLTMEFAMGRAAKRSVCSIYQPLEPKGSKWHWHGGVALVGNVILMMFYTSVSAWMFQYFVSCAGGAFEGLDPQGVADAFDSMLADPVGMTVSVAVVVALGFFVCSLGLRNGLERVSKVMMSALLLIMLVLTVHSVTLPGAREGVAFYLLPNPAQMRDKSLLDVVVAAMNQAFFTLSVGMGSMAVFGSYIGRERSLLGEAVNVAVLDTFVAVVSGLIIFPACFAYGVAPDQGPKLIFVTLPNIFNHMSGGRLWGSLFFVFMSFAAFSTVIGVLETLIAGLMELTGWSRRKTCLIGGAGLFLLSLPCALGFNILSGVQPMGEGSTIMDVEDFAVSNLILPIGSLLFVLFCTCRYGWGWDRFMQEANQGKGLKVRAWMRPYLTWVLPVAILVIIVLGLR